MITKSLGAIGQILFLELFAEQLSKEFNIGIEIYGFDLISGLPSPKDYRDLPYIFKKDLFPNIIDPTAKISDDVKLGFGNIIYPYTIICSNSKVEDFCHLTYSVILAHNVKIGSFTLIGSRSSILNTTKLSNKVFIGANVTIGENLKINKGSSILFGSVVIRDCDKNKIYFGNPAQEMKI